MARELRPRKSRPSYASFADSDNEVIPVDDGSSSEDFRPPDEQEDKEDIEVNVSDAESSQDADILLDEESVSAVKGPPKGKAVQRPKVTKAKPTSKRPPATLSRAASRPPTAALTGSSDHRQRADPICFRSARVERLTQPPRPFMPSVTTPTNSWNSNKTCAKRYMNASSYNMGPGPIWELIEDRSLWKESRAIGEDATETESTRRPRVHESVKVPTGLEIINESEARKFLPRGDAVSNEFASASIKCSFGIPGKNPARELKTLDSFEIDDPCESKAHVFFAGGPVWGLDWCPIYAEDHSLRSYKQYIAVAPLPSKSHTPRIGRKCPTPFPACLQIWSYSPTTSVQSSPVKGKGKETETTGDEYGKMACELVLCIDRGPAQEIKWCPLPAHDSWTETPSSRIRKLGLLAGTFEDGSLAIYAVPDPDDLQPSNTDKPLFVKLQSVLLVELSETSIWSLSWANSERIAVGCTNGSIAVYDIHNALTHESMEEILPTHYFSVHQSAVRTIQWVPLSTSRNSFEEGRVISMQAPTIIASGGYDGCEMLTDIRDGHGSMLNRTRDVVLAMTYSRFSEGVVTLDLDYIIKTYTMHPSNFGRGNIVIESGGPVWNLHTSDYHPILALASADGSVLTTNLLRPSRRSSTTPPLFFKIFQMDFNRKTGEYRMLDHFLPQVMPDRSRAAIGKKKKQVAEETTLPTGIQGIGAWSPEVSVTRVAWNNGGGPARAPLLASATASGLCRVSWLLGFFQDERVPYGAIEYIRNEIDTGVKFDKDEDN